MIDWEALCSVVIKRARCSRNAAWSAIAEAYLSVDRSKSEGEQAAYILGTAPYRVLNQAYHLGAEDFIAYDKLVRASSALDDVLTDPTENLTTALGPIEPAAPEDDITDDEYLLEITKRLFPMQRICVIIVCKQLLNSRKQARKPLTPERIRQLLKGRNIPQPSEMAKQVYTFLTTLKRDI